MVEDGIADPEHINEIASNPKRLRQETEDVVGYGEGDTGGYIQIKSEVNLNAFAIGLGLENIEYEPEEFAGLVYRHAHPDVTIILTWEGQLTAVDAAGDDEARDAIISTIETLETLELYEEDIPDESDVTVSTLD